MMTQEIQAVLYANASIHDDIYDDKEAIRMDTLTGSQIAHVFTIYGCHIQSCKDCSKSCGTVGKMCIIS